VKRWARHNERHRAAGFADRNTEYLFYQTLAGAWPIDRERMTAFMEKAVREAKMHTSWTNQDETYERSLRDFVSAVMEDAEFHADFEAFLAGIVPAGRLNSLTQTLIKFTAPGIPDTYQGTELWDLSLVDPDNRRAVDFALRRRLLDSLARLSPTAIMTRSDEGLPKLWIIRQALWLRRRRPQLFGSEALYRPLYAQGAKADHVVAFARAEQAVSVAPRLPVRLGGDWADTTLELPADRWRNILTDDEWPGGLIQVKELLAHFPVALLVREE
jgi:(1->4)-alpha-D-glucan 1-alpha-D-glucosylmutase